MFNFAANFNECLSTWAEKTSNYVDTVFMLLSTSCPGKITPDPEEGPWCQGAADQCSKNVPSNCIDDPDVRVKGKTCKKYLAKKRNKRC